MENLMSVAFIITQICVFQTDRNYYLLLQVEGYKKNRKIGIQGVREKSFQDKKVNESSKTKHFIHLQNDIANYLIQHTYKGKHITAASV